MMAGAPVGVDHVNLEPGIEEVQHGQPHLHGVVSGRELLAIGHDHVALLGADHQDPQLLFTPVGIVIMPTIIVGLGWYTHFHSKL